MNYAAYCRVSTGSEEQLNSLVNQRRFFEEYAKKRGDTLVKIYADRGISGKSIQKREEFLKLLEDSKEGRFDAVLVKDISRFARNTLDFLTGIRILKSRGVDVIFIGANQNTLGESEFVLTLFAALAQEESCALSKKIIFGKKQGAKAGRVPNIIYGYDKINTYKLAINQEEANTVKKIYSMYVEKNMGLRKIAKTLNEYHILSKNGGMWSPKTVRRILTNPIYMGVLVNNKTETVDFLLSKRRKVSDRDRFYHMRPELAIVKEDMFLQAQNLLASKAYHHGREGDD